ncbi:hypothetical protein [Flavobacterium praedii]|uniref:hypothetical protein n=1 Tax=Flavobacterium praedii TaxID=3002900 RepID=UPI002481ACC8|nr:hypothetical protein [Flavobacterium praedii]
MKKYLIKICLLFTIALFYSCYGVNAETSEIGDAYYTCRDKNAWNEISNEFSTNQIKDSTFLEGLKYVENHFLKPDYIIYFKSNPREIVGISNEVIRVAFNPKIFNGPIDGLTPQLSDKEQVRIRNRVLKLLYKYECPKGKRQILKALKEPAIFGKEYYENK